MSRLQELLDELCPNGVEYKKIGEIADFEQPSKYIVSSTDYNDDFETPVLTAGQTFVLGYTNEKDGIYEATKDKSVIIFDDFTGAFKWVDFPFKVKSSAMKMITAKKDVALQRYLYHLMGYLNYSSDEHKRLWISIYSELSVPVPPLEVQCEIVRVLDSFTLLTDELIKELTDEITARKKQYEYYKQRCFDELQECEKVKITDIALIKARVGWQRLTKAEYLKNGDYCLITGTDFLPSGRINFDSCVYVSEDRFNMDDNIKVHKDDVLITKDGTLGKVALICEEPSKPTTLNSGVFRIASLDDRVDSRYLYHFFTSKYFTDFVESVKTGSTIPHLTQQGLLTLDIPLPSRSVQEKIIDILDRYMKTYSEVYNVLISENEKRQKQYEFYRDKLLSFKELERAE